MFHSLACREVRHAQDSGVGERQEPPSNQKKKSKNAGRVGVLNIVPNERSSTGRSLAHTPPGLRLKPQASVFWFVFSSL